MSTVYLNVSMEPVICCLISHWPGDVAIPRSQVAGEPAGDGYQLQAEGRRLSTIMVM